MKLQRILILTGFVLTLLLALLSATRRTSHALIQRPLSGGDTQAKLKLGPSGGKISFSKSFTLLTLRDPGCPTESYLQLTSSGASSGIVDLPCQNWRFTGGGYRYDDPSGAAGGVRKIAWKGGKLKIVLKGSAYTPILGPVNYVEARLTVGNESYCGRFAAFDSNSAGAVASHGSLACNIIPPTKTPTRTPTPTKTLGIIIPPFPTATPTPDPFVFLLTPLEGKFLDPDSTVSIPVSGFVVNPLPGAVIKINGAEVWQEGVSAAPLFDTVVAVNPSQLFQPILAEMVADGIVVSRDRVAAILSEKVLSGVDADQTLALRIQNSLLTKIGPHITDNIEFDITTVVHNGQDLGSGATASGTPQISGMTVSGQSKSGYVELHVVMNDFTLHISKGTIIPPPWPVPYLDCGIDIGAEEIHIYQKFNLSPDGGDPVHVNATVQGNPTVTVVGTHGVVTTTACQDAACFFGDCDADVTGGDLTDIKDGIHDAAYNAVNGIPAGGDDPIIAQLLEDEFDKMSIAADAGDALGVALEAPMNSITEDSNGVTINADSEMFLLDFPPPGTPQFAASVLIPASFPSIPNMTPQNPPQAYDVAMGISSTALNQYLKTQAEAGMLTSTITYFPTGNGGLQTLNAQFFASQTISQFLSLPPLTPFKLVITPRIAPIVTGETGASGEKHVLQMVDLRLQLFSCSGSTKSWLANFCDATDTTFTEYLSAVVDFRAGLDFTIEGGGLKVALSEPASNDIAAYVTYSRFGGDSSNIDAVLPEVVKGLVPSMSSALGTFPLPEFGDFGLSSTGLNVSRSGQFLMVFLKLD